MTTRVLTERDAWGKLHDAFLYQNLVKVEEPNLCERYQGSMVLNGRLVRGFGLCWFVDTLEIENEIDEDTASRMRAKIDDWITKHPVVSPPYTYTIYMAPLTVEGAEVRRKFCLEMMNQAGVENLQRRMVVLRKLHPEYDWDGMLGGELLRLKEASDLTEKHKNDTSSGQGSRDSNSQLAR